jgi:anti-sigma factor RsiW
MMQDNEQDILLLSAYIDNKLTNEERVSLESRLQSDPALQEELAALRETVALIRQMPKLKAPRSYTLDPAIYGKPRRNILDFGWLRLVPLAAAAVLAVVIGAGLLISQGLVTQKESASESLAVGQRDENTQTESETVPNLVQPIQTATALGAPTEVAILSTIALPSPTAVPTQTPEFAEGQLAIPAQAGQDE